jgi:hypothetical protein
LESGAEPLSDGGSPATGRCPAYVSALVFARNVTVRQRQQPDTEKAEPPRRLLELNPHLLEVYRVTHPVAPQRELQSELIPVEPQVAGPFRPGGTALRPAAAGRVGRAAVRPLNPAIASGVLDRLSGITFTASTQPSAPVPAPAPQSPPAAAPTDEVAILAFICKRLGRCPDPDPTLTWA